ncbi:MAG: hypothetical protein Q4P72_03095 [Eubacteriales bacterium]|nr:hypothetical protein [Eubacteriales bacterium]
MKKIFKVYSLNPLLAGLLLIGALGGVYVEHKEPFRSNETKVVLPMDPEESSNLDEEIHAPFTQALVGNTAVREKLLEDESSKPYELLYQDRQFVFQPAPLIDEDSEDDYLLSTEVDLLVKPNEDRLALFTVNEGFDDVYRNPETGNEEAVHQFQVNHDFQYVKSSVWDRLRSHRDTFFKVLVDGERIIFDPLPNYGIKRSAIRDDDLYALVKYEKIEGTENEHEDSESVYRENIIFILIRGAEVKDQNPKSQKQTPAPPSKYYPPATAPYIPPTTQESIDEWYETWVPEPSVPDDVSEPIPTEPPLTAPPQTEPSTTAPSTTVEHLPGWID